MNTKFVTLTAVSAAFLASQAFAVSWTYSDYRDVDLVNFNLTNENGQGQVDRSYVQGAFDIVSDDGDVYTWDRWGFEPGAEVITGGEVAFGFADYTGATPSYLGDVLFSLGDALKSIAGSGGTQSAVFDFGLVTPYMGDITGELLVDLSEDGLLSWKVELDDDFQGQVSLYWAALAADAEKVTDTGSTAAFLGFSLFVGLAARRRLTA